MSFERKLRGSTDPYFPDGDPRLHRLVDFAAQINPLPDRAKSALHF
jgi:hypothetical protein